MGAGKSLAAVLFPLLKVGIDWDASRSNRGLIPLKPVLIVAPENLHDQLDDEWRKRFGIKCARLYNQEEYLKMPYIEGIKRLKPGFYLSSYTQMGMNGVKMPPLPGKCEPSFPEIAKLMYYYSVGLDEAKEWVGDIIFPPDDRYSALMVKALSVCEFKRAHYTAGIGEENAQGIKCICSPTLADLTAHEWECLSVDEGTRLQGEATIIGRSIRGLNPKYRLVLTGTPVKNRLKSVFWLAHWAAGGKARPHARFPYSDESDQDDKFAAEFMVCERNLTREAKEAAQRGGVPVRRRKKPRGTPGIAVCGVHRLWKLLAPIVLRRRKAQMGSDMVKKIKHVIRAPMGSEQYECYKYHLEAPYVDVNGMPAIMSKLQALRSVAAAPTSDLLKEIEGGGTNGIFRSTKDYTPKLAACLRVLEQRLSAGEQSIVFSDLHEPLDTLSRRLTDAGIPHDVLDGRKSPQVRGRAAKEFKAGLLHGAKPIMLAGQRAMGEGNSFSLCTNVVMIAYSWGLDTMLQAAERIYRLDSPADVHIWAIIADGTVDRKLESSCDEKNDSSELVLDGKLITQDIQEESLFDLLQIAERDFRDATKLPESQLEAEWPALKRQLADSWQTCRAGKKPAILPPIITPAAPIIKLPTTKRLMEKIRGQIQYALL
jgi:hypothetical protein